MTPTKSDFLREIRKRQLSKKRIVESDYLGYLCSKHSKCASLKRRVIPAAHPRLKGANAMLSSETRNAMIRTWGEQVNVTKASVMLGVSRQTIYNYEDSGQLIRNAMNRFYTRDVIAIMEGKAQKNERNPFSV